MTTHWTSHALKVAISGLLLGVLFSRIEIASIWSQVKIIDLGWLALATALMLLQVIVSSLRWGAVLGAIGARMPLGTLTRITFLSLFFNLALPASVGGDAVRVWQSSRRGLALSTALNGVLLERVASVVGTVLLLVATHPLLRMRVPSGPVRWVIAAGLGAALGGLTLLMLIDRLPASWQRWAPVQGGFRLARDARALFLRPRQSGIVLGLSVAGQLNLAAVAYLLAIGLRAPVSLLDAVLLMPLVVLVSSLPISFSGWGVREGAMVVALGLVGVPSAPAMLLSILLGLVSAAVSLGGGIVWWFDRESLPLSVSKVPPTPHP